MAMVFRTTPIKVFLDRFNQQNTRARDRDPMTMEVERENAAINGEDNNSVSMEQVFSKTEVPTWTNQITMRAFVTSLLLSVVFSFIACKLNLTTGVIPSLNVAARLLGFAMVKAWTKVIGNRGYLN